MNALTREDVARGVENKISFEGANLKGFDLKGLDLSGGLFKNANFRYADLTDANMSHADLSGASLRHAVLVNTDLRGTDLTGADLSHADMRGVVMIGAKLSNARIHGAKGISEKVFFTQQLLEELNAKGELQIDGDTITVLTKTRPRFRLQQAVRFTSLESGRDEVRMLGKVRAIEELKSVRAEVFTDSVVIRDSVYRTEAGFIGLPVKEGAVTAREEKKTRNDEALLAEFFLKHAK